jgi:RNA-directed DNA polymerase
VKCRYGLKELFRELNAKLRGYYDYYGVVGNYASLKQFFDQAIRILYKWLNRRSQRRSYNWTGFRELLQRSQVERPRIVGRPSLALRRSEGTKMAAARD